MGSSITVNPAEPDSSHGYCWDAVGHVEVSERPDMAVGWPSVWSWFGDSVTPIVDYGNDFSRLGIDYMCECALASGRGPGP